MQKISLKKALDDQNEMNVESIRQYAKFKIEFYDNIIDKLISNCSLCIQNELECLFYHANSDIKLCDKQETNNFSHPIKNKQSCVIYEKQLNELAETHSKYSDLKFSVISLDPCGKVYVYAFVHKNTC